MAVSIIGCLGCETMTLPSCWSPSWIPVNRVSEMQHRHACRGYFSISSQVQPNDKGQYPDTYLNIGGGNWSKGVAFVNGFNLVCF